MFNEKRTQQSNKLVNTVSSNAFGAHLKIKKLYNKENCSIFFKRVFPKLFDHKSHLGINNSPCPLGGGGGQTLKYIAWLEKDILLDKYILHYLY